MAEAKSLRGARAERPLSPHLQVYAMPINMLMSIVHRITGAALYFGSLLLAWWLVAAAAGPDYFNWVNAIYGSLPGRLVLFGYTWALVHHMLGGVRHLIWDTGAMFDKKTATTMAWATLAGSIALTVLVWIVGYMVR